MCPCAESSRLGLGGKSSHYDSRKGTLSHCCDSPGEFINTISVDCFFMTLPRNPEIAQGGDRVSIMCVDLNMTQKRAVRLACALIIYLG